MYKAVFIDIDDTLLDYIPCCREAFDAALGAIHEQTANESDGLFDLFFAISGRLFSEAKRGLHTIAEVMELYPAEFIEKSGLAEGLSADAQLRMTEEFKHAFRAAWGNTHTLVPDAKETLEALQAQGCRLFAASNSFGHLQRSRLQHAGILHLFEDTYISMDIGYDKPDVRFYEEALRRCRLQPHEVLMVGDSMTTDILGAQAAGLDTVFFDRREEATDDTRRRFTTITALSQLAPLLADK
jgi:HAD superfamily hydrolase (TIGR01549 family)